MKKLLAIAVAAGLAAPIAVMADTTLYGLMKISVGSDKNAAGDSVTTINAHTSRLGVKGATPMDNGLSITHKLEFGTAGIIDNKKKYETVTARDGWVGLKGNFGEVRVGRHFVPISLSSDKLDFMNIGGHASLKDGPFRDSNQIVYLKGFGPVSLAASYMPDEKAGQNTDTISTLLNYNSNGIYASWGYKKVKNSDATNNLALGYTTGAGHRVGFVYNKASDDSKNTALNGRYKFGKAYVQGEIGKRKDVDGDYKVGEVGYTLGKGTTVWGSVGKNDMGGSKASHARVGITTSF